MFLFYCQVQINPWNTEDKSLNYILLQNKKVFWEMLQMSVVKCL